MACAGPRATRSTRVRETEDVEIKTLADVDMNLDAERVTTQAGQRRRGQADLGRTSARLDDKDIDV